MTPTPGPVGPRKAPTAQELRAWRAFIETSEALKSVVAAQLQAESGLSRGDYGVLLALSEAPGRRLRSSHLADTINWERSRLSHHLRRMEQRGLVIREAVAQDDRGAHVVLTPEGAHALRNASPAHLRTVQSLFINALAPEQLGALEEVMSTLRAHLSSADRCEQVQAPPPGQ